jgi:TRAP-type mannitol/chloroaromatic compound transport system permease large subunit
MLNGLKLALALFVGLLCGSVVNMGIITLGPMVIPPPAGADMMTAEGIAAAMPLLEPKHFIAPFLAHALGTLVGAIVAALLAPSFRAVLAYAVGVLFLAGGIAASMMIPAPSWFIALDLVVAYIPMAWLGLRIADRLKPR